MSSQRPFVKRNWKERSPGELASMSAVAKSRYLAYEPAPGDMEKNRQEALQRLRRRQGQTRGGSSASTWQRGMGEHVPQGYAYASKEEALHFNLMGEIRAAERRKSFRKEMKKVEELKALDILSVVDSQPRGYQFAKSYRWHVHKHSTVAGQDQDTLTRRERRRCEQILADDLGLTTTRDQTSVSFPPT